MKPGSKTLRWKAPQALWSAVRQLTDCRFSPARLPALHRSGDHAPVHGQQAGPAEREKAAARRGGPHSRALHSVSRSLPKVFVSSSSFWLWLSGRVVFPLLVAGLLFLAACGQRVADAGASAVSYGSSPGDKSKAQMFTIPAEQMAHLQVTSVEVTRWPRVLRLTGSVAYNSFKTTPVITQVSGPVSQILVSPGEVVRTGQPMLYVSSPDYAQARSTFMKARDAFGLAEKSFNRANDLYAHHAIAEADLQQADSTRNQALADLQTAEQSLKAGQKMGTSF